MTLYRYIKPWRAYRPSLVNALLLFVFLSSVSLGLNYQAHRSEEASMDVKISILRDLGGAVVSDAPLTYPSWSRPIPYCPQIKLEYLASVFLSLLSSLLYFVSQVRGRQAAQTSALLSGILQTAPAAIICMDASHRIAVANPAAEEIFRYPAGSLVGQPLSMLLPATARERHAAYVADFAGKATATRPMADWRKVNGLRGDGVEFPVQASVGKTFFENSIVFTTVLRDMTEEAQTQEKICLLLDELRQQGEQAKAANQSKTMFLASISHELRTPLNAIIGFSDILRAEMFGPIENERYKGYINDISFSGNHLLKLIDDILDMTRLEVGSYRFDLGSISLYKPIIDSIRMVQPLVSEKRLALRMLDVPDDACVFADQRAVRQVVTNILSNAIKFTDAGGAISVAARLVDDGRNWEVCIEDTGRGMHPDELERIGQPFVQVGDPYKAEAKGTGLGLTICRNLVEGMAGKFRIESQYGVGTGVCFQLPRSTGGIG